MYIGANVTAGDIPTMNFGELVVYNQYFEQSERQLLEGYLAWKWSLVNKLPGSHPFYNQSPIEATVSESSPLNIPAKIPSLTTWLDAADSATIVLTGGTNVSRWNDKSATSDVFTATTNNPKYSNTTSGPSLPGVYFSGKNALLGTVKAAIASGIGTCFMIATMGTNAQVFTGGFVSGTPQVGNSFGLVYGDNVVTCPLQSDARNNRNPLPGTPPTTATLLYSPMNATITPTVGEGSYGFATPTNVVSIVNNQSVSWQPSVPSASPWNLGYLDAYPAMQDFYLHEFLCFSEYFTDGQRFVVEGYLAWKWGIQSQLPNGHPYKNARPVAGPGKLLPDFSPDSIVGLQLWLDAADSATITGTTVVTAWKDKSANGYIATQSPISVGSITRSTQNNLNVIVTNLKVMTIPSFSWSRFATMFFVVKTPNWFYVAGSAQLGGYFAYFLTGNWALYNTLYNVPSFVDSVNTLGVNIIPSSTQWCILSIGYGGGTQATNYCINGTPRSTNTVTGTGNETAVAPLWINGRWDSDNGDNSIIAEILHYNSSITTSQRQQVEGYLAWKWGLQRSLPSTHPYSKFAP
jgi:hypothetical protein